MTPFLFFYLPRPLPCGSGDRRRAAHRPFVSTPVPVPPGFHQVFPTAIPTRTRHLRGLLRRSCSGDRHARVRGPREGRVICRTREARFRVSRVRCMHFEECMRTSFPSSASSGHPLSPVRYREGRRPVPDAGPNQDPRSDGDPRRTPPSRRPGCLPPLRAARPSSSDCSEPDFPRRSPAHAAHTFSPGWGKVPSRALQAPECGHPRSLVFELRGTSASVTGESTSRSFVPGTDDPSALTGSTNVARLRELIALLVPTPDAAPLRLLRPRARGPMCRELHEPVYA